MTACTKYHADAQYFRRFHSQKFRIRCSNSRVLQPQNIAQHSTVSRNKNCSRDMQSSSGDLGNCAARELGRGNCAAESSVVLSEESRMPPPQSRKLPRSIAPIYTKFVDAAAAESCLGRKPQICTVCTRGWSEAAASSELSQLRLSRQRTSRRCTDDGVADRQRDRKRITSGVICDGANCDSH